MFMLKSNAACSEDDGDSYDDEDEYESDQSCDLSGSRQLQSPVIRADKHMAAAQSLLLEHTDINNANALRINRQMQAQLRTIRVRLEHLLAMCRAKYADNETLLMSSFRKPFHCDPKSNARGLRQLDKRKIASNFFGAPFFKTMDGFSPAYNAEVLARQRSGELFRIDLTVYRQPWTTADKVAVIAGVREQLVERLQRQFKHRQRLTEATGRPAVAKERRRAHALATFTESLQARGLAELLAMLPSTDDGDFDWFTVSQKHLNDRHSCTQAQAMWTQYLHPSLNRAPWTPADEERLTAAVLDHNQQDWPAISRQMGDRSAYQCLVHFRTRMFDDTIKSGRWTSEEDERLLAAIERNRCGSMVRWDMVASALGNRSRMQAYYRYTFSLRADIRRDPFTLEEDCILMAAIQQHGEHFEKIVPLLPGRSRLQIRNRHRNVLRHKNRPAIWSVEMDERLLALVAELGESNWSQVAEQLGTHTRTSCRSRYVRIRKFLASKPGASVRQMTRRHTQQPGVRVTSDNWMDTMFQLKAGVLDKDNRLPARDGDGESQTAPRALLPVDVPPAEKPALDPLCAYLRYACDLKLSVLRDPDTPTTDRTMSVCRVLGTEACPIDYRLMQALPADTIDMKYLHEIDGGTAAKRLCLPVNRSTALLLRGLAVMFADDADNSKQSAEAQDALKMLKRTQKCPPELQTLRQRLRALLFEAMASAMGANPKEPVTVGNVRTAVKRRKADSDEKIVMTMSKK